MEKAILLAQAMKKPSSEVSRLQQRCLDFLVHDINRELPAMQPVVQHVLESTFESSPPIRRRRTLNESQIQAIRQIEAIGSFVDNPGEGNCLFHCFAAIENEFLEMRAPTSRARNEVTHKDMRAEVVATLRADSALVRVALVRDVGTGTQHAVFAEEDMIQQKGSVADYCNYLEQDGISGRSVRTQLCLAPCAHTVMVYD
jgi:hypothetical protein